MKVIGKIKPVLAVALLAVMGWAAFQANQMPDYEVGDYFDTKGIYWQRDLDEVERTWENYVASLIYEGKDPPVFESQTSGTIFGLPVTALNYRHVAYHGSEDCIMSILFNPQGKSMAIAYTAPYKKTAELEEHLDFMYERLNVVCDVEDPIFTQTWAHFLEMTVSLGEYGGRNVFLVSDITSMIASRAWK